MTQIKSHKSQPQLPLEAISENSVTLKLQNLQLRWILLSTQNLQTQSLCVSSHTKDSPCFANGVTYPAWDFLSLSLPRVRDQQFIARSCSFNVTLKGAGDRITCKSHMKILFYTFNPWGWMIGSVSKDSISEPRKHEDYSKHPHTRT